MSYGMKTTSQLMHCRPLPTTFATRKLLCLATLILPIQFIYLNCLSYLKRCEFPELCTNNLSNCWCSYARCTRSVSIGKLSRFFWKGVELIRVMHYWIDGGATNKPKCIYALQSHQPTTLIWLHSAPGSTWSLTAQTVDHWRVAPVEAERRPTRQHPAVPVPPTVELLGPFPRSRTVSRTSCSTADEPEPVSTSSRGDALIAWLLTR